MTQIRTISSSIIPVMITVKPRKFSKVHSSEQRGPDKIRHWNNNGKEQPSATFKIVLYQITACFPNLLGNGRQDWDDKPWCVQRYEDKQSPREYVNTVASPTLSRRQK
jgi:hypothetical protein